MGMGFTPRMHTVLGRAATEAKYAGLDVIGTEHVFLAILEEEDSVPTQVLSRLGFVDQIRTDLRTVLESEGYRGMRDSRPSSS